MRLAIADPPYPPIRAANGESPDLIYAELYANSKEPT